jgi:hypothetical protein
MQQRSISSIAQRVRYDDVVSIRRGRMRSTIKWGGAVLTVLLLIVWVASVRFEAGVLLSANTELSIRDGQLRCGERLPDRFYPPMQPTTKVWFHGPPFYHFRWWFAVYRWQVLPGAIKSVHAPIWFFALLTAVPTAMLWRRDCKLLPGTCPKCGYDRTGLPANRACPECGSNTV